MNAQSRTWLTAFLINSAALFLVSCTEPPTQSEASSAGGTHGVFASQSSGTFSLNPPSTAPYPDATAGAKIDGQFLDGLHPNFPPAQGLRLQVHGLPCRCYSLGSEPREFYVVYLSTESTPAVRLLSFNTSFLSNVGSELVMQVPLTMPLFSETVTVEVYLEADDAQDGPAGAGVLVLRGQLSPS